MMGCRNGPRVLPTRRTSARGNAALPGWLAEDRGARFQSEPDRFGDPTFDLSLSAPDAEGGAAAGDSANP